jgi:hypothetical protein
MSIKIIKLVTGEELIGELINSHHNQNGDVDYEIKDVAIVQMIPTQTGLGLSLFPFAPYTEDKTHIFRGRHIIIAMDPGVDLINNYNKMFGSGIQIASAGSLIK